MWRTVLFWVLGILAAAAMWFGYRILRLAGRSTQLTRGNLNRQAVMHFRHLRFLSKLAGCEVPPELEAQIPPEKREGLRQALACGPIPGYQHDPTRRYGFNFCGRDVRFTIEDGTLTVVEIVML